MSVPGTALVTIQPVNFGGTDRGERPPPFAKVGLIQDYPAELTFNESEPVLYAARVRRWGITTTTCSVTWRIEGTGSNPFLAEHFDGGAFPSGTFSFTPNGSQEQTLIFALAAVVPPVLPLTGRIYLDNPVGCQISPAQAEIVLYATEAIIAPDDPLLALNVAFVEIEVGTAYTFTATRSANTAGAVGCSWRLEGTGDNPILASYFGGTLPSGAFAFADGATSDTEGFAVDNDAAPTVRLTGRIVLHSPTGGAKIDPTNFVRDVNLKPAAIVVGNYDLVASNIVVHLPADGQASRVSYPGGVAIEIAGDANDDSHNLAWWWKVPFPDNYKLSVTVTKNEDDAADAGGRWINFWHGFLGGVGGSPVNVAVWTTSNYRPASHNPVDDATYGDQGNGGRISFDTESTVSANRNEARDVEWNAGGSRRLPSTPDPPAFAMAGAAASYDIDFIRQGTTLTIRNLTTGQEVSWVDSAINRPGSRQGFKSGRGRGFRISKRTGVDLVTDLGSGGGGGGGTIVMPHGSWRKLLSRPTSGAHYKPVSSLAQLRTTLASAVSGDVILTPPGVNWELTDQLVLSRAASGEDAIYITTDTDSEDPSAFTTLRGTTGRATPDIVFNGARRLVINGINYNGGGNFQDDERIEIRNANLCQWERGRITGITGGGTGTSYAYKGQCFKITGDNVHDFLLQFVEYSCGGAVMDVSANVAASRLVMSHLSLIDCGEHCKLFMPGRNPDDSELVLDFYIQYVRDVGSTRKADWVECKRKKGVIRHCMQEMGTISGYDGQLKMRHGQDVLIEGVTFIRKPGAAMPTLSLRNRGHRVINCKTLNIGVNETPTLTSPTARGEIWFFRGEVGGDVFPVGASGPGKNKMPSAYGCEVGGNAMYLVPKGSDAVKPAGNRIGPQGGSSASRNLNVDSGNSGWGSGNNFNATIAGANYETVPIIPQANQVGPRAWRATFSVG